MIEIKYIRRLFWTAFWFTLLTMCFMGCASQKRCFQKFPPEIREDSTSRVEVEYRDTTVRIYLPGDTIREEIAIVIPCPEGGELVLDPLPALASDTVKAQGTLSEAQAWIERADYKSASLQVRLIEYDTTLSIKLDSAIIEARHWKTMYSVEIHKPPPERIVPWYYRASLPIAIVLLFLIFAILMFRIK